MSHRGAEVGPQGRTSRPSARRAPVRRAASRGERLRFAGLAAGAAAAVVAWSILAALANRHWYAGLLKPFFAPAPWLAGLLLVLVASAAGRGLFRVLCQPDYHPDRPRAIRMVLAVFGVAAAWVWAFFVGRHPTLSLALAAALVLGSGLAIWRVAAVERRAAALLAPWALAAVLVALVDLSVRLRNG